MDGKTPKIAPTGDLVAERRTIGPLAATPGRAGQRPFGLARRFSSSSLKDVWVPIISSSRLHAFTNLIVVRQLGAGTSPHALLSLLIYSKRRRRFHRPVPYNAARRAVCQRFAQWNPEKVVESSAINTSPPPSIVASPARPACVVPSERVENGSQEDRDQGHQG